ncbi:TetR/AcrR family transcriptional regulator [Cellulomonas cellasea]|uniref:TetR/AcrR family transcriptional regulator n=1 Tax=Cellulomonas cellasea TaxID=43670 RepID=UPI0025A46636|nr:TetR/AcrR family transcriptional regulator [Cellulomonas cellasea]MDM8084025.1 TetR/AcrR family transcriptional regulator [Cellulomonas cellasea]
MREGLAHKRAGILAAARELFVRNGVERTSMDAVAAQAAVSKRTVYDYYGDKRRLLLGVIEDAGTSALRTLRAAIADNLPDGAEIDDTAGLERALADFAVQLGASMLASADYAAAVKLITENEAMLPELTGHPLGVAHRRALAERIAHYAERGLLDVDDPAVAADHFNALTVLLVLNEDYSTRNDPGRVHDIMAGGVHAFMRAYARRPDPR